MTDHRLIRSSTELSEHGYFAHMYVYFEPADVGNFEPADYDVRNAERRVRQSEGSHARALAVALGMAVEYAGKGNTYDAMRELDQAVAIVHADYDRLTSAQAQA